MTKLQKQFAQRKTKKIYLAIVEGEPKPEQAVIDAPIARNPKKPQTFRVSPEGKSAQTQYSVLKSFVKKDKRYSLLELKPLTGRTHQLRVHLAYIGHPIVGDHVYGSDGARLMLHATSLEITIPTSQRKVFEAAMPQDIKDFISV